MQQDAEYTKKILKGTSKSNKSFKKKGKKKKVVKAT